MELPNVESINKPYYTPAIALVAIVMAAILGMLIGSGIMAGLLATRGIDPASIGTFLNEESSSGDRNFMRLVLAINQLFTFLLPALAIAFIIFKSEKWKELLLDKTASFSTAILGVLFLFWSFPFIQYTFFWNKQIPLPDWMMGMEESTNEMLKHLMMTNSFYEVILNLLVAAVLPALGEELVFRGFFQRQLQKITSSPHLAIWIVAIVFSAIHMQFQGFIPRMLLGAMLGYLFYWTNNLWVPIIAHFFHNGMQVIAQFLFHEQLSSIDLEQIESVPIWTALFSLVMVLATGYFIWKNNSSPQTQA